MARRILYMIDSFRVGGAETLMLDLLEAAAARGAETHVAYFSPGPLATEISSRTGAVTRLSKSGIRDPRATMRALRLIRRWKPDVVHTHLTKSDVVGQISAFAAGVPRRIVTLHNTDPWRRNRLLSAIYRAATAKAHAFVAVSEQVADYVAECGSAPRDLITVISNGVDLERFDPGVTKPLDLTRWGVPEGAIVVAVIGRLTGQKDHATFLRAAAGLSGHEARLHFLVVGDGELRAELTAQAAALGLTSERLSFTGVVREMPALLAAVDIVVLSSAWEGLPMTILEAMAMARPIAATRVGGIPNVIEDGRDGLLVPAKDAPALARAVEILAKDRRLREAIGQAGRKTVCTRFGGKAMLDRLFAIYDAEETGR